jgi:hypothetical protein
MGIGGPLKLEGRIYAPGFRKKMKIKLLARS